ncbi:hypothetical protein VTN77DRAFT_9409 [Rasamsonia byssochlamydoides]|uniref:uncharacterized protein n=1 Tax=Rasamsonia byssochlamydoides TaxID=89139 RepID=UPI003744A591
MELRKEQQIAKFPEKKLWLPLPPFLPLQDMERDVGPRPGNCDRLHVQLATANNSGSLGRSFRLVEAEAGSSSGVSGPEKGRDTSRALLRRSDWPPPLGLPECRVASVQDPFPRGAHQTKSTSLKGP